MFVSAFREELAAGCGGSWPVALPRPLPLGKRLEIDNVPSEVGLPPIVVNPPGGILKGSRSAPVAALPEKSGKPLVDVGDRLVSWTEPLFGNGHGAQVHVCRRAVVARLLQRAFALFLGGFDLLPVTEGDHIQTALLSQRVDIISISLGFPNF